MPAGVQLRKLKIMTNRAERLEMQLGNAIKLLHLQVLDESGNHNVPDGAESHYKVVAVADSFAGMTRINRHRLINQAVQAEFDSGMHALAVHAYSPEEWQARFGEAPMSPPCLGGEAKGGAEGEIDAEAERD